VNVNQGKKASQINNLQKDFEENSSFYLVDFTKMSVSQSVLLRKKLRENSFKLRVVKNRLALRALKDEFPEELRESFQGPTGIMFTQDSPIVLAKLIKEFSAQYKVLSVKAGYLEGRYLDKERFSDIAALSSKQDLIAKLAYLMASPLTKLLRTWQAPFNSLGSMLSQLKSKK
jgi:large subunit ribosomal protein L10